MEKQKSHTANKSECNICGKSFVRTSLRSHLLHVHRNERKFKCCYCDAKFKANSHFRSHIESVHNVKDESFECNDCHKVFTTHLKLQKHKKHNVHNENKPKCSTCGKSFSTSGNIRRHLREAHGMSRISFNCDCVRKYF